MNEINLNKTQKSILKDYYTYERWFNGNLNISEWDREGNLLEETFNGLKNKTIDLEQLIKFDKAIYHLYDTSNSIVTEKVINNISFSNLEEVTERVNTLEEHITEILNGGYSDSDILGFDFEDYKTEEGWADTDYYESLACPTPDTVYKGALNWYPKLPETKEGEYVRLNAYEDGFDTITERELLNEALNIHSKEILQTLNPQNQEEKLKTKNVISC